MDKAAEAKASSLEAKRDADREENIIKTMNIKKLELKYEDNCLPVPSKSDHALASKINELVEAVNKQDKPHYWAGIDWAIKTKPEPRLHPTQEKILELGDDKINLDLRSIGKLIEISHPYKVSHHKKQLIKYGYINVVNGKLVKVLKEKPKQEAKPDKRKQIARMFTDYQNEILKENKVGDFVNLIGAKKYIDEIMKLIK